MSSRFHLLLVVLAVAALIAGGMALSYSWWSQPLRDAEHARAAGRVDAALDGYREASRRLSQLGLASRLFAGEQAAAIANQFAVLYRARAYDAVMALAASAPANASPHFWSGTTLLRRALDEPNPEARLVWLTRAEADLKQALQAAPSDWNARFNYEVAARLSAQLRKQPQKPADTRLQLLRPQPPEQPTTRRRVG